MLFIHSFNRTHRQQEREHQQQERPNYNYNWTQRLIFVERRSQPGELSIEQETAGRWLARPASSGGAAGGAGLLFGSSRALTAPRRGALLAADCARDHERRDL